MTMMMTTMMMMNNDDNNHDDFDHYNNHLTLPSILPEKVSYLKDYEFHLNNSHLLHHIPP